MNGRPLGHLILAIKEKNRDKRTVGLTKVILLKRKAKMGSDI